MRKRKIKWSWRRVLSLGVAVLLICGAIAGVAALTAHLEDDMKTIHPSFKIGALDAEGAAYDDKGALYTPEAFKADGLEINLDFDSHLSYRVFFYTSDDEFVGSTEVLTKASSPYMGASLYARVVLYPIWDQLDDDDEKIGWYQVWGYTSDVEIRVLKDGYKYEKVLLTDGFFEQTDSTLDGRSYSYFTLENTEPDTIDAIYFDRAIGATQEMSNMSVVLAVGDDLAYYYNDDLTFPTDFGEPAGELPTKDKPVSVPSGSKVVIYVFTDTTDYNDLVAYVHKAPASSN